MTLRPIPPATLHRIYGTEPPQKGVGGKFVVVPLDQRFWSKVDKRGPNECWLWIGDRFERGYGKIRDGLRRALAHRLSWEFANGMPAPAGMMVCHSCDNPPCVNPAHLWLGTAADNNRDMVAKGRDWNSQKTHCPKGHPYSESNTYMRGERHRCCRECLRKATAQWRRNRSIAA